jgi:hypothetical protein
VGFRRAIIDVINDRVFYLTTKANESIRRGCLQAGCV